MAPLNQTTGRAQNKNLLKQGGLKRGTLRFVIYEMLESQRHHGETKVGKESRHESATRLPGEPKPDGINGR
jgi:hypothetical protein